MKLLMQRFILEDTSRETSSSSPTSSPKAECAAIPTSSYDSEDLYEKVWKLPMRTLAREYGVSDVALAKTCRRLKVPVPGRGYWAKKAAKQPLEARPPLPLVSGEQHEN